MSKRPSQAAFVIGAISRPVIQDRTVAGLVPARVGRAAAKRAASGEDRDRPSTAPSGDAERAEAKDEAEPEGGVAQRRAVAPRHQLLHPLARDLGRMPLGPGPAKPNVTPWGSRVSLQGL